MKSQTLGATDLRTTRLAYGCMRIAGYDHNVVTTEQRKLGVESCLAAYEAGYRMFDHADLYGGRGACERIFGEALEQHRSMRDDVLISTKCGIRLAGDPTPDAPKRYDFTAKHILWSCEQSLQRLGVDRIDVYLLHRPDLLCDPHEVAAAFDTLQRKGMVRCFGVSNFLPSQVSMLQKYLDVPIVVNQVRIHLGDLGCFDNGTLDQCMENQITPMAWRPLGGGLGFLFHGKVVTPKNPRETLLKKLFEEIDSVAVECGVSRTVIALAWLLKHPGGIIPVVGSTKPDYIREAAEAVDFEMSREVWYRLWTAARGTEVP